MIKTRHLSAAAAALILIALPASGGAQSRASAADAPIGFGARTVEYEGDGSLTLRGAVELTQGQNRFRADQMTGLRNGEDSNIVATGDVYFVTPTQTIRGDRATYDTGAETIVVTGEVILTQGQNVMTGSRLTYNVRTESARIDGGEGGRVRGVFYPESNGG